MTTVDALYTFAAMPPESSIIAINGIRDVYGIRSVQLDERAKTIRVEFDATRFSEPVVRQLLRRAGLNILEEVDLMPQPAAEPAVPTPA